MTAKKAIVDGSSIAVLTEEIRNLGREFRDWREQVYGPGHIRVEQAVIDDKRVGKEHDVDLASELKEQWRQNSEAHSAIICRLDALNGWKNKVQGVLAVVGLAAPLAVAIWAIMTKG